MQSKIKNFSVKEMPSLKNQEQLLKQLKRDKRILNMLCQDFTAVYYIDLNTGKFTTMKLGEDTNATALQKQDDVILDNFDQYARQYADRYIPQDGYEEFLSWFNCRNLKEKLLGTDRITYHYRSKPNHLGKKFFDTQAVKVHVDNKVFKVFMSFRHIDDILEPEVTTQENLQKALDSLKLNNEIISTIGKSYDAIFRIDLSADYFEEVSTTEGIHRLTGQKGRASRQLRVMCTRMVAKQYQLVVRRFCDLRKLAEKLANDDTIVTEYQLKSGNWQKLRFIVKKRNEQGVATHVLCCLRNISDFKRREIDLCYKEAAAKKDAAEKNRFLATMSHDIRTPLNGIIGMMELAEHHPNDLEIQSKCRTQSMEALKYLVSLVNDVLDMNKLETGEITHCDLNFDLAEFLDGINREATAKAKKKKIQYILEWDKSQVKHKFLLGNPVYAGRILSNIVDNAIKFSPSGSSVHVWVYEEASHWDKVVYGFYCQDNGIGMSKDFVKQAFDMFSQEKHSARTEYMGSGLGLAIAKKLSEKLHGTIELHSTKGKGTTAIVKLPFKIGREQRLCNYGDYQNVSLQNRRILAVDDNELNRDVVRFLLEDDGIKVEEAVNGQEAVEKFRSSEPGYYDVILMDVMMPVLNGWEATGIIRSMKRWDADKVSIIAMSANAFVDDIVHSRLVGMDMHLSKPLTEKKLIDAIKQCLCRHMKDKKL